MLSFMAFKHRKLFPTVTNQTTDCLDFCDPTCPYNCYPYPDLDFIPPSPPPPSADDQFDHSQPISPFVIIIISLLVSFFLLISYYAIIVKYCAARNGSRNRPPPPQSEASDEEHLDENQGPVSDHPVWFITTVGLQQAIINSIAVCRYKKGEGFIEGTECLVCLSEFQEDEVLRLLPKCSHAFHIHCIDTWLRSHTNCPLCRARIVSDINSPPLALTDQNSHILSVNEESRTGNYESDGELGENQARNGRVCENRAETEDEGELREVNDERMSKEGVKIIGDMVENHQNVEDEIQKLRRSVSMDSASGSTMCLGLANFNSVGFERSSINHIVDVQKFDSDIVPKQEDRNSSVLKLMSSSSIAQTLRNKSPVSMKRSSSYNGRS